MRFFLPFLALLISSVTNAQITVTAAEHNPSPGQTFEKNIVSNPPAGFNGGSSGAGVTWDFSNFTISSKPVITISAVSGNADYPDADMSYEENGTVSYFKTGSGAWTYYGFSSSVVTDKFSDGEEQVRYPMSYGDSYTDAKAGTRESQFSTTSTIEGELEVTADAYGTLITKNNTYNDVLRVQFIRYDTTYQNGVQAGTRTDTVYYWYASGISFPVASYFKSGGGTESLNFLSGGNGVTTGLQVETAPALEVYPNPASDVVNIRGLRENGLSVEVFGLDGNKLASYKNRQTVPVQNLSKGVYLLRVTTGDGVVRRMRFLKK